MTTTANGVAQEGWSPTGWLGGLALPVATPTAVHLYAPRGVWMDAERLVACDTGNHRVLIWQGIPERAHAPADVVPGQATFFDEGPAARGRGPANGLRLPTGVIVAAGRLLVADAGNHRVLGWRGVPTADRAADLVLGQPGFTTADELPHRPQGPHRLRFPYGLAVAAASLAVADTANNRVLAWTLSGDGPPRAATAVLGQGDFDASGENRWRAVAADTLCWPYGLGGHGDRLAVADSGNNRVMLWRRCATAADDRGGSWPSTMSSAGTG